MTRKLLKYAFVLVILVGAGLWLRVRYQLGYFAGVGPSTALPVQLVRDETGEPFHGAAELAVDRVTRRAYFPVFGSHASGGGAERVGRIYMLSLDDPALPARDITPRMPKGFHPHGMDLLHEADGRVSLYVVNVDNDAIEIFDLLPEGGAAHRETITDPSFIALNAVTVVGPRRFYLTTNDAGRSPLHRKLEAMLHMPLTHIVYFDGVHGTPVVKWLNHCSGLVASKDGTEIYVGEGYSRRLRVYRREPSQGKLELIRNIPLHTAPDDLEVDPDGSVWTGAHPQPYKVYRFAKDPSRPPPPSQVVRVDLAKPDAEAVEVVFQDDGTRINSSSSAARVGNLLLISSVFGSPVVVRLARDDSQVPAYPSE